MAPLYGSPRLKVTVIITCSQPNDVLEVLGAFTAQDLTPFVFSLESGEHHAVYHAALKDDFEKKLANSLKANVSCRCNP